MSNVSLKLSAFEGPLDLLMHLIESNKIDIYDIPIVEITEQYIGYLRNLQEFDMELASEFLVMAATLLQIKSRMLLPKEAREDEDEGEDPREQLVQMLVEYRRIKRAAIYLRYLKEQADRYVQREPLFSNLVERYVPSYPVQDLLLALGGEGRAPAQGTLEQPAARAAASAGVERMNARTFAGLPPKRPKRFFSSVSRTSNSASAGSTPSIAHAFSYASSVVTPVAIASFTMAFFFLSSFQYSIFIPFRSERRWG